MEPDAAALPPVRVRAPGLVLSVSALVVACLVVWGGVQNGPWAGAFCIVLAAVPAALVVQAAVARVSATPDGLVARSPWRRTIRLGWDQIDRFEVSGHWKFLSVRTADQRWIRLLPYANLWDRALEPLARLEAYRRQHQPGPG